MPHLTLVTANDITQWADLRTAQGDLPRVVRRLVHATTTTATRVGFPAGEGIQTGGWDGVVIIDEEHAYVPRGASVWEVGTGGDPKAKANRDYKKRTEGATSSVDRAQTAFVFVTARRWAGKDEWASARRREAVWKDVRAYDADDLEEWHELAPGTHLWFSALLGKKPPGADDPSTVWNDWSEMTQPAISANLIIAGREQAVEHLHGWLLNKNSTPSLRVSAESRDEALAFVTAALECLSEDARMAINARTVVVHDVASFDHFASGMGGLLLIPTFVPGDLTSRAIRAGHRVLLPEDRVGRDSSQIEVPRVSRDAAQTALVEMGVPYDRARDLSSLARRSVLALRRTMSPHAGLRRAPWATPAEGPDLAAMLLLGQFNQRADGDREMLSTVCGASADDVVARLVRWENEPDPPVRRVGDVWYWVSKEDGWASLERCLTPALLGRFASAAIDTLTVSDPRYDLPADQQWAAGLYGKRARYSGILLDGIADTVALLGARGGSTQVGGGQTASDLAARIVRTVLERALADPKILVSVAPYLPRLAEGSPDAFLTVIGHGLEGEAPPVMNLFSGDDGSMFSTTPHTGLLWALETLAWSPDHLAPASLLLAALARLDPGGKLVNRPANSLQTIFLGWFPQAGQNLEGRFDVIDLIRKSEPDVAWQLMDSLLPMFGGSAFHTPRPRWREWGQDSRGAVTDREAVDHVRGIVSRMLADAGNSTARWLALVEALDKVPLDEHTAILRALSTLSSSALGAAEREAIWNAIRILLSRHRSFRKAKWALPEELLAKIEEVFHQFEPDEVSALYAWLFSDSPGFPEGGEERDYYAHADIVAARRVEAAKVLWTALKAEGIVTLALRVDRPDTLGYVLGRNNIIEPSPEADELLIRVLAADVPKLAAFGRALASGLLHSGGREWVDRRVRETDDRWSPLARAELLIVAPADLDTWALVETLDSSGQKHYWENLQTFVIDAPLVAEAAARLLAFGRPHAAIGLLARHIKKSPSLPAPLLIQTLTAAAHVAEDAGGGSVDTYHLGEVLDALEAAVTRGEAEAEEVAQLEFLYLPLLSRYDREPRVLHAELARDPALFVDAAKFAYRGEHEEPSEGHEKNEVLSRLAYELLSGWRGLPGLRDGDIDSDSLSDWVTRVRSALAAVDRKGVGDILIGNVLARSPRGSDGAWPHEVVRDIVETLKSEQLESGISTGKYNLRGVVSKNPLAGGGLERSLVQRYEEDAAKLLKWPRCAALLRRMAAGYRQDAEREDADATLRHDLE